MEPLQIKLGSALRVLEQFVREEALFAICLNWQTEMAIFVPVFLAVMVL